MIDLVNENTRLRIECAEQKIHIKELKLNAVQQFDYDAVKNELGHVTA